METKYQCIVQKYSQVGKDLYRCIDKFNKKSNRIEQIDGYFCSNEKNNAYHNP